ncbi:hypothetical protein Tco_0849934, partial [Tanacetum coccineum]
MVMETCMKKMIISEQRLTSPQGIALNTKVQTLTLELFKSIE